MSSRTLGSVVYEQVIRLNWAYKPKVKRIIEPLKPLVLAGLILPQVWDETYTRRFDLILPARDFAPPVGDFAKMPCILIDF